MILAQIQTLIVSSGPTPSILVLSPVDEPEVDHTLRILPIWMGTNEATQIGLAIEEQKLARPMTHDLFLDALTNLDARVDHVLINNVEGQTFYSILTLRQHDRLIQLDARPSDSIALAVREQAPIYIEEDVLQRASFPYIFKGKALDDEQMAEFHTFVQNLSPEDFK